MDEEDGRPGALATQAGQLDAIADALPLSLCPSIPSPELTPSAQQGSRLRRLRVGFPLRSFEVGSVSGDYAATPDIARATFSNFADIRRNNENVPGK